jgi:hypothetical protein
MTGAKQIHLNERRVHRLETAAPVLFDGAILTCGSAVTFLPRGFNEYLCNAAVIAVLLRLRRDERKSVVPSRSGSG